jgi:hypothetical protein
MRIAMDSLSEEKQSVLAGAPNGRRALARLLDQTRPEPTAAEPVYLDFAGVEIATASFLREAVLSFRDTVRGRRSNLYPIVANASQLILDELSLLIAPYGDVLMTCLLNDESVPSKPALIGDLDPKQKLTFDLVSRSGETDASELMREHGVAEGVKQTAWNNRLSALAALGLVFELSQGRSKRYRPLFGGC